MAVLDDRRIVPALDLDQALLADSLLIVAVLIPGMGQDVVWILLMQLRRAVLHGLDLIKHERICLILHLDGPERLRGGNLVLRDNGRYIVAIIPNAIGQELPVRHILMVRIRGPRVAGGREPDVRHIEAGDDLHHALDRFRLGLVDAAHHPVGDRGVQNFCDQRVFTAKIVRVLRASRYLVECIDADDALSNAHG